MLTLLETTEAIKALRTEPDIIKQACEKVLGLDGLSAMAERTLAKHLIFTYVPKTGSTKFMLALTLALGQVAALKVKRGRENELVIVIADKIREEIISFQSFEKEIRSIIPEEVLSEMREALAERMKGFPK